MSSAADHGSKLASMQAQAEIRRVLDAIAFATDAGDWRAFLAGFAPQATCDYGELGVGPIEEVAAAIERSQAGYLGTMNFVGTHRAWPSADGWMAETYVISHHFRNDEQGRRWDDHVGTRYEDRFVATGDARSEGAEAGDRGEGHWRIAHRLTRVVWFRQDELNGAGWL